MTAPEWIAALCGIAAAAMIAASQRGARQRKEDGQ